VALPPEIDISNDAAVFAALTAPLATGAEHVTADMSGTRFCGVAGARAVLQAATEARDRGAVVQVTGMRPQVRLVFKLMTYAP
jgi:anti-anti-sigma regulatory factor